MGWATSGRLAIALTIAPIALLVPAPALADQQPPPAPPSVYQELTLRSLGINPLNVSDPDSTIEVLLPAPGAPLASRGSFVRVFFSHSADVGAGSTLIVSVNGQALTSVALTASTGPGAVFEVPVPAALLRKDAANSLQAHFTLLGSSRGVGTAGVFARLDQDSLIHYQLIGEDARALSLAGYPYSLLSRQPGQSPSLEVVLPQSPDAAEMAAAWRLLADLGHRAGLRQLRPAVTTAQTAQFASDGVPRLIVGRVDRLQAAPALLQAAGFSGADLRWRTATGADVKSAEGMVAAVPSPADHVTPVVLATGATDAAVETAAAALVGSDAAPLAGSGAVVTGGGRRLAITNRSFDLSQQLRRDMVAEGSSGERKFAASFAAPAADRSEVGTVNVSVLTSGLKTSTRHSATSLVVAANGQSLGTVSLDLDGRAQADFSLPGRLLGAGLNSLSLDFHMVGAADARIVHVVSSITVSLPGAPTSRAGLENLPYPFFDGPEARPTMVVVPDTGAGTLSAAATAMVALGSRSIGMPPRLEAGTSGAVLTAQQADSNLIVVGTTPTPGQLEPLGRALSLTFAAPAGTVAHTGSDLRVRPGESLGTIEALPLPGTEPHQAIWISGTTSAGAIAAGLALYQAQLGGSVATVDGSGLVRSLPDGSGGVGAGQASMLAVVKVLIAAAVAVMLGLVGLEVWRRREVPEA